jgi:hypothetical protein
MVRACLPVGRSHPRPWSRINETTNEEWGGNRGHSRESGLGGGRHSEMSGLALKEPAYFFMEMEEGGSAIPSLEASRIL